MGKDGNSSQAFAEESKLRLKELVQGNIVKLKLLKRDQYGRAVALVLIPRFLFLKQDISLKLLDEGLAVVYRGRDACYGSEENKKLYDNAEFKAKKRKKGIWSQSKIETPGEYKKSAKNKTLNK
jgi:endonuclease YncB( thermonuclease family)